MHMSIHSRLLIYNKNNHVNGGLLISIHDFSHWQETRVLTSDLLLLASYSKFHTRKILQYSHLPSCYLYSEGRVTFVFWQCFTLKVYSQVFLCYWPFITIFTLKGLFSQYSHLRWSKNNFLTKVLTLAKTFKERHTLNIKDCIIFQYLT